MKKTPTLLVIMDGWGHRADADFNAVTAANTPHFDALLAEAPHGLIDASSVEVGLPKGQMGNSEVGHMNIGGGRKPQQVITRINTALENDANGLLPTEENMLESIAHNKPLLGYIDALKESGGACNLMGICSDGKVHGDIEHVTLLAKMIAAEGIKVWIHVITDGRDTDAKVALEQIGALEQDIADDTNVAIATIGGRAYAMDRDQNWGKIQRAYDAITQGIGHDNRSALEAIEVAYARGEADEDMQPSAIFGYEKMMPEDGLLMTNFRPDRARQIMAAFTMDDVPDFAHKIPKERILGMANYWDEAMPLDIPAMFDMEILPNTLGEVLQQNGKKQLHIAETEKYAHVTSFFNGNNGQFDGEERVMIPSPKVASYDLQPEMSAPAVTKSLLAAINTGNYDFLVVNYANPDMVGHTGNFDATVKAIETVDDALGTLREAIKDKGGSMLVTADHGNADRMQTDSGEKDKKHTTNPVPFIVDSPTLTKENFTIRDSGTLSDIAPTILSIMGLEKPIEMTGDSLLASKEKDKNALHIVTDANAQDTITSTSKRNFQ